VNKKIAIALVLAACAAIAFWLWTVASAAQRRAAAERHAVAPVVRVNDRTLRRDQLEARARTLFEEAKKNEHLVVPAEREEEALGFYRKQAAKMWIVKETLLAAALADGVLASDEDVRIARDKAEAQLKTRGQTLDDYFKSGPIPEADKRADFLEGAVVDKYVAREVESRIEVKPAEIDAKIAEMQKLNVLTGKPGKPPRFKTDRKSVIDALRADRIREGFRQLFRAKFATVKVSCPEIPELETLEGVSPGRPEDGGKKK